MLLEIVMEKVHIYVTDGYLWICVVLLRDLMMVITLRSFCSPFLGLDMTRFVRNYLWLFVNYLYACICISFCIDSSLKRWPNLG